MMIAKSDWQLRESGPVTAEKTVLLLPGALCTAMFYAELMAQPSLAGVHLVAATLPGHGGTPAPEDVGVENYALLAAELAAELRCDAVVGHSLGANVALEMVAAGRFRGPVVLLAPSLSRVDESIVPRILDRLGRVLGRLPFSAMLKIIGPAFRNDLPHGSRDTLIAELHKNDPRTMRSHLHQYLRYLDRHGSVAPRLCASGVPCWVVLGETDDVGITDTERATLQECPHAHLVTIADTGHFLANQQPARVAELVTAALDQAA